METGKGEQFGVVNSMGTTSEVWKSNSQERSPTELGWLEASLSWGQW